MDRKVSLPYALLSLQTIFTFLTLVSTRAHNSTLTKPKAGTTDTSFVTPDAITRSVILSADSAFPFAVWVFTDLRKLQPALGISARHDQVPRAELQPPANRFVPCPVSVGDLRQWEGYSPALQESLSSPDEFARDGSLCAEGSTSRWKGPSLWPESNGPLRGRVSMREGSLQQQLCSTHRHSPALVCMWNGGLVSRDLHLATSGWDSTITQKNTTLPSAKSLFYRFHTPTSGYKCTLAP